MPENDVIETVEIIDVTDSDTVTVDSLDAFPAIGERNEDLKHQLLNGRELSDQHPITAITGLREELDDIEALDVVYSDERNQADYYLWEDENILQEDRIGYFVTGCSDINEIKICKLDDDVLGVTVDNAGFIGAQSDVARDIKYGLVVTTGIVHVRCELSVNVGDYVIPNNYGYAQKNENGYKVVARHQIHGVEYAEIILTTPISRLCKLSNDVKHVNARMDDAEVNIVTAINTANAAYNKANESSSISEEALKDAMETLGKIEEADDKINNMEASVSSATKIATEAKTISESAVVAAENIRSEAVTTANSAVAEAEKTQKNLQALIDKMDPMIQWEDENGSGIGGLVACVNGHSTTLALMAGYEGGDNESLAGISITVGEHEAVLNHITSHQGVNGSTIAQVEQKADDNGASITNLVASIDKYSVGEYSQAYGLTREQAASILKPGSIYIPTESHSEIFVGEDEDKKEEFTREDYYVWGINDQGEADWIEHNAGKVWISEAIPANSSGTLKYWYINSSNPPSGYEAYALYIWEDSKWKQVSTLAGNASNRAMSMIRQTTNEIALDVVNARGSYAGLNARLEADKEAQVAMVASVVGDDGKVTSASIINAVNDSGSSVTLNGDHIVLNGATTNGNGSFQIHQDGYMIATGGTVGGWGIGPSEINAVHIEEDGGINSVRIVKPQEWGPGESFNNDARTFLSIQCYNKSAKETSWPFWVRSNGEFHAEKADIQGNIKMGLGDNYTQFTDYYVYYDENHGDNWMGTVWSKANGIDDANVNPYILMGDQSLLIKSNNNSDSPGVSLTSSNGRLSGLWKFAEYSGFDIDEDINIFYKSNNDNNKVGFINYDGDGYCCYNIAQNYGWAVVYDGDYRFKINSGGVYLYDNLVNNEDWSDSRLKNSIEEFTDDYEVLFDSLQPKRYKYNNGTSNRYHTGYIAQDVVDSIEQAGLTTSDLAAVCLDHHNGEDRWYLRRDEFVALNTWQIQKAKTRIKELEERVAQLEALIK